MTVVTRVPVVEIPTHETTYRRLGAAPTVPTRIALPASGFNASQNGAIKLLGIPALGMSVFEAIPRLVGLKPSMPLAATYTVEYGWP